MASPDDVGTYSADTPAQSAALRTYAQQASAVTGAGGETCAPPEVAQARMACEDILREGAAHHMTYLNRDYYEGFFAQWLSPFRWSRILGENAARRSARVEAR